MDFARDRFEVVVSDDGSPESPEQRVAAMRDLLAVPANPYSTATQLIVTYVYEYCEQQRPSGIHPFNTGNLAVPAAGFAELGGFSGEFPLAVGEDYDFCHRRQHAGHVTE